MSQKLKELAQSRTALIDKIIRAIQLAIRQTQNNLFERLMLEVFNELDLTQKGRVASTAKNKRALSKIDGLFENVVKKDAINVVKEVIKGVDNVIKFNVSYYEELGDGLTGNVTDKVTEQLREWLGIKKGTLKPNGYLDTLINDNRIKKEIQDLTMKTIASNGGVEDLNKALYSLVKGSPEKLGSFERYLGGYAYDTISVSDRIVSLEFRNEKGYNFGLYEGGLIGTSRKFCIDKNGQVFHVTEIEQFKPTQAIAPDYNPFIDMGGFRCRHHWNWISDSMAIRLRPDAKKFINE